MSFKMSTQVRAVLDGEIRKFPENPEEARRKNQYPEICFPCKNIQCPYRREENYGKPCQMLWKPAENVNMNPTSKPNPNEQLLRIIEETRIKVTEGLQRAFKPLTDRLDRIEKINRQINTPHSPTLNGERIPLSAGTNQERIKYVD